MIPIFDRFFRRPYHAAGVVVCKPRIHWGWNMDGRLTDESIKILLVKHRKYGWSLPFGKIERGESTFGAAIRECREETGIEIKAAALLYEGRDRHGRVATTWLATHWGGEILSSREGEVSFEDPERLREAFFTEYNGHVLDALEKYTRLAYR